VVREGILSDSDGVGRIWLALSVGAKRFATWVGESIDDKRMLRAGVGDVLAKTGTTREQLRH
jgi:hypothetical protein